tara:strand:- start:466 stop:624 length:159 start_codon:yes stop_codon:yes gene_type:complete
MVVALICLAASVGNIYLAARNAKKGGGNVPRDIIAACSSSAAFGWMFCFATA